MAQATVKDTTGYVNYVYNISARGTTEVASQLLGLSGMATNILGQLAFQTNSYISTTEGALLSMGVIATAGLTKATQQAMEFDQALSTIGAISGQTRGEVTKLGDDAMAMSNKFGVAVSEMTEGMESLARAGVSQGNMTAILEEAMGLSKLEGLTLDTAINDLISTTNLLDTQGLDSSSTEYADAVRYQNQKITATSEAAPIGAQDIIHTLEHIGGYASSTNLDQDDLYAVIAQLGSKGTKSEMAGTSLRAFIAAGQKDTAQRALNRIGLNVKDLWKNDDTIMSITDMKDVLDEAMESRGYTQQEKLEFYSDFAGYKQANQIMKIDTQSAREFKEKIDHSWNMGQKIAQVIGTAETHVQGLIQAGTNLLTKVGEPFLPIISTIAVTLKTGIDIINAIPGSNLIIAGGLILVSVKAISTIFNKIAPQILAAKGNIGSMREFFDSIVKSLKESYTLIKNINNTDWIKRQAHINEVNHITNDDKMRYWQDQTGKKLYGMTDVYRLEKEHGFKNNQKYIDWKMRENYKTKKSRNERNETQNEPTGTTESSNNRKNNKKSDCCDSIIQVMKEGFINQISNANTIKDRVVDIYGFLSNSAIDKSVIDDLKTNIFSVYVTNMGDSGSSGGGSQDSKSVDSSKSNTRTSSSSPKSGTKLFTKGRLDQAKVDKFIDDFHVNFGFDTSTNEGRKTQEMLNNYAKDILRDNFKHHRNKLTGQKREVLQKIIDNEKKAEDQPYRRSVTTLGAEKFDSILASYSNAKSYAIEDNAKVYSAEDVAEIPDAFRRSIRYKPENETADDSLADLGFDYIKPRHSLLDSRKIVKGFDYTKARDNLRDSGKFFIALANLGDVNLDDVDMTKSTYRSKIRDQIVSTLKSNDKEKIKKVYYANEKITEALSTNIGYHYVNDLNTTAREDFMKSVKLESTGNPYIDMVNYFDARNQGKITDTKIEDDLDKIKILGNIVYADKDKMNINSEYPYRRDLGKGPNIKNQVNAGIEKALKMQGTKGYGGIASHIKKITDSYVEMAVRDDILEMQKEMEKETGEKVSISDVIKATPSLVSPNRFKINHRVYDDIGKESPDLLNKEDTIYNGLRALHNKNIGGNEEYRNRTFGENDFGQLERFKLVFADEKPGVYYEKEREELSNLSFQSLLALIQPPEITKAAEDIGPKTIGGNNTGTKNVGVAEVRNLPYLFEGTPIQNMGMRLPTHGAKMDNTAVMGTAYISPESALGDFNPKIIKDDTGEPVAQEVEVLKGFIRNDRGRYHEATNWALTQSRNREEMRKRQEVAFGSIAQNYGISRQDIMQMPLTQSQKERIEELYGQQDFVDIKQYIEENGEDAFKQLRGQMSLHKFDYDYDTGKLVDNGEMFTIKVTPEEYKRRLKANLIYKDEGDYGILSENKNKKTGEETYTIHDFDALHYSYNDIKRRVLLEDFVRAKELESHNDFMTKNGDYISEYLGADGPYTVIPDLVKADKDLQDYDFYISEKLSPDDIAEKLLDAPINQIDTLLHTIYSYNKKLYNKVIDSVKTKRIEEQGNIKEIESRKEDVRSELERFDSALNIVDNIFPNLKNILSNKEKKEYMKLLSESDRPMDELMVIAQRHGVNVGGINLDSPENLSTSLYNDDDYYNDIEYDFVDAMNQSELPDVTSFDVATVSDEITAEFLEALGDTLVYDTRNLVSPIGQDAGENRIEKINKILNTDINKDRLKDYQAVNDYFNIANAMALMFGDKKTVIEPIQDSFLSGIDVSSFNNIGTNLKNKTQIGGYEKELIQDSFLSEIDVSSFNNIGTNLKNKTHQAINDYSNVANAMAFTFGDEDSFIKTFDIPNIDIPNIDPSINAPKYLDPNLVWKETSPGADEEPTVMDVDHFGMPGMHPDTFNNMNIFDEKQKEIQKYLTKMWNNAFNAEIEKFDQKTWDKLLELGVDKETINGVIYNASMHNRAKHLGNIEDVTQTHNAPFVMTEQIRNFINSFDNQNSNHKTQVGGYEKEPTVMDVDEFDASKYIYDNFVENFNIDDYNQTTPKKTPISFAKNIKGETYVKTLKDVLYDFTSGIESDKKNDLNNAAEMYTSAKEHDIGSSDLGLFLGRALLLTGKEDDALSELLDSQEKSPRAGILASLIQLQQNNVEEAVKTLNLVKQQHAGNEKIINEANSILSQILPQDNARKTFPNLSDDEDYKKAVGVGPSQNIPQPRPDPEHYDEWLNGQDNARKTVIEPMQDSFLSGIDVSLFNNIGTDLKNKKQVGGYEQGREIVDNIKQRLDNFISPKIDKMYKRFGNHDNSKVSDKLDDWSGKLIDATDTLQGFSVYLKEASELFPPLSIAVLGLEGIITTVTKINKGTQALNSFLDIGDRLKDGKQVKILNKVFSSNNNAGKMLISATGMVGEAFETLTTIFWKFLGPIALITAGLIAIKGALDWSYQSHQKYLKSLEEDQKEHRSKAKGLQRTNENAQELARNNRAPRQQAALDRNAQLAQIRLDNANMTRSHGAIEITRQKNDTLWGDYGIAAGLGKLQGNYESTASEYDGTTGQVRRIKEATLANPFSSEAMNQVSSYYDANQLAFGVMDEYKDELGKLYDSETSAMLKYHSDDVRGSPEFNKALDDFVQATGITRDHAKQYLDYMQTEHEVDKATQAMQAQADQISANTELKVQAIAFGGNPADVLGLNGIEAQQGAMIKAQADMIKMELSGQLWWKAVWATITTPIKLILSPIFIIVDLLNAIWSLMTGNIGGAFESGGRAASRLNVFGEAATYWGAWAETEGTDFSAIGQSATDSYNRTNYGNVEQSASGGYHPTHYLDANASQDRRESVGGGYSGGQPPRGGYSDHRESQTHYTNANRGSYHFMNSGGGPGEGGGIQFNPLGAITGLLSSILGVLVNGLLIGGGIYGIYKLIKSDFNFKDLGAGILNTIKDKGSSLLYDVFEVDGISSKATDILGKFFNLDGIKKRVSGISAPATEDEKGNLTRYGQLVKAKEDFLANNAWGNYLGEKLMPDDFSDKKRKTMNKKDRDYLNKRYGLGFDFDERDELGRRKYRTAKQKNKAIRQKLDSQGVEWDDAMSDLHNNRYMGKSLKDRVTNTVRSYADPWREYLGNQYETRKQNFKDNVNGYVGGLQEEAERYRAGDIREEDLSDGARLYARGLDIKDQIFGKASQTDFSALINNPAEFLSDPRNIEKMGKDIYSNYKNKYQKAKEDPAAQEEYDWYKEGGAMRFMDLSRENKIRAIGDKLSGIKTGMFGMEEGESVREMLKNPERTIEVLQNARKSIQENGWMESLGLDEDFGVSDAVKDKVSGFFDKIKEGAEEGIDDDEKGGNGGLIERAKKKLAGLFGFGKEEETPESEPTTADKDPNSLKNIIKNKDKDPKAYAKYLEMNKADHDVGAPLLGNEERYSVLGGEKPDELANMSYKERIQYMKDQAEITKARMGDPFIKEETPGAVAEEPSIMDIADTYSLSDIADNFGMNKGGSIGDIIDKVGGGKKNPLSKIGQKGKGALGKLGGKKGIGGLAKGGVGKLAKGGIGKAVSGIGGKAVSKIGSKLASKGIAQIGSKVLGGALIASGIGAPLGLLLESPIGGMLIEGAMDLGGKALGAIGGAASGLLGGIGGLLGFGKKTHYQQAGGKGMNPLGMMMPGIGLAGAIAGGVGSLFGGNTHNMGAAGNVGLMKMISPLTMGVGLLGSIFKNNRDHKNQSTSIGDLAKNILKNLIDGNKEKSNNNSSGGNITIQNININTADDPEAIKAMFLELLIELQEQVNPRIVSRTVGQSPTNSSTTTDTSLTDTSTTDTSTTNENQNNNGTNT